MIEAVGSPIRVLLVDDQPLLRMGFRMILETEPDIVVVGEAGDGRTGISMASALQPDLVLMDIRMPGTDGITATQAIVEAPGNATGDAAHRTRVLILTTFDVDAYVYAGLRAGASGFLLKDAPPAELLSAIRTVAGGAAVLAPTATRRLIDRFMPLLPEAEKADRGQAVLDRLTPREQEVFRLLASGRSNREIADELYLSEGTVKIHVGRILGKLDLRDRVQAVVLAYESGLVKPGS
jgi:DNA-binding NarL/FixJ family response regulator